MKYILLIGDGMGDTPVPGLGERTPLEVAVTPAMDRLARRSEMLLVRTVPEGYPPGSDVANMSLLGFAPDTYYTGRSPLEAASMGIDLGDDDLAFRCNLVTLQFSGDQVIMEDYSAGHITTGESRCLISAIQETCPAAHLRFYPGVSYRHCMVHNGPLPAGLETVPPHDHTGVDVTVHWHNYLQFDAFRQIIEHAGAVLAEHPVNRERIARGLSPANAIWLWGEGRRPSMDPLHDLYGVDGALVSAVDLLKGLAVLSGLEVLEVEGATGYLDTNYEGKTQAALRALEEKDLAVVHVEAPDETGHQGLAREKVQAIEDFDARIVAPIAKEMERRGEPFRLVVTMDHYTPLNIRTHVDWPVPMFIYDSRGVEQPSGLTYSEDNVKQAVAANGLHLPSGAAFFRRFVNQEV
ncbi:MAG: cofactor-independent phosphoglycerate mutase [Deltaproteobacteria bacterium]|nr:MAG: cofactor-independent phosphoglycerate mutase [Deltaproteobacteria bacterium]